MGQGQSGEPHTPTAGIPDQAEDLSRRLAERFVEQCFSGVELYSFKDNFRSLADRSDSSDGRFLYWTEDTLVKFLSIPDRLEVGSILFQSASYIGAFPFPSLAPAILNFEALVKIVVIFTERYKTVLKRRPDPLKLIFRSLAVYDRREVTSAGSGPLPEPSYKTESPVEVYDRDIEFGDDDDDDDLSLAALDALDAIEVFGHAERPLNINRARIPLDNMTKLITLLLVIAPLESNQPIAVFSDRLTPEAILGLRRTAGNIAGCFRCNEKGILYKDFKSGVQKAMPFIFDGFRPLFEHFLFSKKVDMSTKIPPSLGLIKTPLLPSPGRILDIDLLSQLSFFIPGNRLWRRLRLLYAGSEAGFSMGSFETRVLKWEAPTILLVSGTTIPSPPETHSQQAFLDRIPVKRYPPGADSGERVVFGVFLTAPWKASRKDCFGNPSTLLFQLSPTHTVYHASSTCPEYASFNKDSGISFGSPPTHPSHSHRDQQQRLNLGPISLTVDQALEFGVFQNAGAGGAFHDDGAGAQRQVAFEIEEVEVWGCGGEREADEQKKAWAWEEREALLRREVNLGRDVETDRAILEMAGLIGGNRSGGSMS